jgi:hypothetical protein
MSWADQAAEEFAGEYVKFKDGVRRKIIFSDPPEYREFKAKDGKSKPSFDFMVNVDGEDKTMSVTSKRLMDLLLSENKDARENADCKDEDDWYLRGKAYWVTAVGEGFDRQWRFKEIPTVSSVPKKKKVEEPEEEEEEAEEVKPRAKKASPPQKATKEKEAPAGNAGAKGAKKTGTDLLLAISARIKLGEQWIPFKLAELIDAASVEEVRDGLAALGYEESTEVDKKSKLPVWKPRKGFSLTDLPSKEELEAAEREEAGT